MQYDGEIFLLEDSDYIELEKLRNLLELDTVQPYTILIFAQARIKRLQKEVDEAVKQGYNLPKYDLN